MLQLGMRLSDVTGHTCSRRRLSSPDIYLAAGRRPTSIAQRRSNEAGTSTAQHSIAHPTPFSVRVAARASCCSESVPLGQYSWANNQLLGPFQGPQVQGNAIASRRARQRMCWPRASSSGLVQVQTQFISFPQMPRTGTLTCE